MTAAPAAAAGRRKPPNGIAAPPVQLAPHPSSLPVRVVGLRAVDLSTASRAGFGGVFGVGFVGPARPSRAASRRAATGARLRFGWRDFLDRPSADRRHAAVSGPAPPPSVMVIGVARFSAASRTPIRRRARTRRGIEHDVRDQRHAAPSADADRHSRDRLEEDVADRFVHASTG